MDEITSKNLSIVLDKAVSNLSFREMLIKDPKHVLEKEGVLLADKYEVAIFQNTKKSFFLWYPLKNVR